MRNTYELNLFIFSIFFTASFPFPPIMILVQWFYCLQLTHYHQHQRRYSSLFRSFLEITIARGEGEIFAPAVTFARLGFGFNISSGQIGAMMMNSNFTAVVGIGTRVRSGSRGSTFQKLVGHQWLLWLGQFKFAKGMKIEECLGTNREASLN